MWDQDPQVIAASTDREDATVAFEDAEWADEFAQHDECSRYVGIVIDPLNTNTRAHAFYQRLGFVPAHRQIFAGTDACLVHRLTREDWARLFPGDAG